MHTSTSINRALVLTLALITALIGGCTASTPAWQVLETGSDASLRGACAVGDGVVWASGSGGAVIRSIDSGNTWQSLHVPGPETTDIRDIQAIDAKHAWVISITEPARILRTIDGGTTWQTMYESANPASFFDSITLLAGGGGIVFGDPQDGVFEILRSDDREHWSAVAGQNIPTAGDGEAAFAASGTCIVSNGSEHAWIGTGGMAARVLRSTDAGRTWSAAETPMPQGESTTGIYSVAFRDQTHGVIIGGDYTKPQVASMNAAITIDGGQTWSAARVPPSGYRSCIVYMPDDPEMLIAVGRAGCDYSTDGGHSWMPFGDGTGYYAVSVSPDGLVIAVGADGRAARLQR